jgi:hypothetical protein
MNQTTTISIRVSLDLKRRLESQARSKGVNLTTWLRDEISQLQAEKIMDLAQKELTQLEVSAGALEKTVNESLQRFGVAAKEAGDLQRDFLEQLRRTRKQRWFDTLAYWSVGALACSVSCAILVLALRLLGVLK